MLNDRENENINATNVAMAIERSSVADTEFLTCKSIGVVIKQKQQMIIGNNGRSLSTNFYLTTRTPVLANPASKKISDLSAT